MVNRRPAKTLLTDESVQTGTLAGLALGCVGIMLIGGIFIVVGFALTLVCSVLILVIHRGEIGAAWRARKFNRHLVFPIGAIVILPVLAVMIANKHALLTATQPKAVAQKGDAPQRSESGVTSVFQEGGFNGTQSAQTIINNASTPERSKPGAPSR